MPSSNTTIVSGNLHYSTIQIPAGVTVQFTGSAPAIVVCDGDCFVHGTLSVAATGSTAGPGAVSLGRGADGRYCPGYCPWGCPAGCWPVANPAGSGQHFGVYGSSLPFSLEGGSPGGDELNYGSSNPPFSCCNQYMYTLPGGRGGGTLVLLVGGRIEIDGTIDADGANSWVSTGSAGALLLRGTGGVQLLPNGQILAGPPTAQGGRVRIDAWGAQPAVQGTIAAPPATIFELPHLHMPSPPSIGTTWTVGVLAPANTLAFVAGSTSPGAGVPTMFGNLAIDPPSAINVGSVVVPAGSHDPIATIQVLVPNHGVLIGVQLWLQGFAVPLALPPRLTNGVATIVQ
ncbi:MAG: hypothetical protein FJ265_19065 [Planctomycetes bacterium]|nr:hypothetical protein [Planctomycetota bacterium]